MSSSQDQTPRDPRSGGQAAAPLRDAPDAGYQRDPRDSRDAGYTQDSRDTRDTRDASYARDSRDTRDAGRQGYVPRPAPQYDDTTARQREGRYGGRHEEGLTTPARAAIGLTFMAAVLMMVSGAWNILEGIAAMIRGTFVIVAPNYVYSLSSFGWGLFHAILGAVVFVVGAALFTDKMWARGAGVAVAALSAVINFLFIPYAPLWSIVLIAIDIVVIWALLAPRHHTTRLADGGDRSRI